MLHRKLCRASLLVASRPLSTFFEHFVVGISVSNSCLDLSPSRWFLNVYFYSSRLSRITLFKQGPGRINCCKLFLTVLPVLSNFFLFSNSLHRKSCMRNSESTHLRVVCNRAFSACIYLQPGLCTYSFSSVACSLSPGSGTSAPVSRLGSNMSWAAAPSHLHWHRCQHSSTYARIFHRSCTGSTVSSLT